MKCLWITRDYPYPANGGDYLYTSGLIAALEASGVQVTALCQAREDSLDPPMPPLGDTRWAICAPVLWRRALSVASALPRDAFRLATPELRRRLVHLLETEPWDAIVIEHAASGWASAVVRRTMSQPPPLVYVSHNVESVVRVEIAERFGSGRLLGSLMKWDARKYRRLEHELLDAADLITCITQDDQRTLETLRPDKRVLPLLPGYEAPGEPPASIGAERARRILMVGSFAWIAKRRNLEEILEVAHTLCADHAVELQVVGRAESAFVRHIESRYPRCEFRANVDSVLPFLREARVGLIAERLGGGFKLKALDYVFNGLPVAALRGSLSGLPLEDGRDAIVRDDLQSLLEAAVQSIDDLPQLQRLQENAWAACANAFDWSDRGERLKAELALLYNGASRGERKRCPN